MNNIKIIDFPLTNSENLIGDQNFNLFCRSYILEVRLYFNSLKGLENKAKRQVFIPAACIGDPNGTRTHIATVKG